MSRPRENPRKNLKKFFVYVNFTDLKACKRLFKCVGGNFLKMFSWVFPMSTFQGASIDLSFVLFGSVGASEVEAKTNSSTEKTVL